MYKTIKPALILFLTCFVVTGLLALTYSSTKDIIKAREEEKLRLARENVLKEADVFDIVEMSVFENEPLVSDAYMGRDTDGDIVGAVVTVVPTGYADKIKISVGIAADGTIEAAEIIEQMETPGLGAGIGENAFLSQFSGRYSVKELEVVKSTVKNDNEVEAVSGATISSKAVTEGINAAKRAALEIFAKEGG